jgi:DNA-binding beta-propeller fold protein YncE
VLRRPAVLAAVLAAVAAAVPAEAREAFVASSGDSTVRSIDLASGLTTRSVTVGQTPQGVSVTPDGRTLYAASYYTNNVTRVTLSPLSTAPISLVGVTSGRPQYTAIDPTGGEVAVPTQFARVSRLRLRPSLTVGTYEVWRTFGAAYTADGERLVVTGTDGAFVVDRATGAVQQVSTSGSGHVATTPDSTQAWTTEGSADRVRVVALSDPPVTAAVVPVAATPFDVAIAPDGRTAAVTHRAAGRVTVIDVARREVTRTVALPGAFHVAFTSNRSLVVTTNPGNRLVSVDAETGVVGRSSAAGVEPWQVVPAPSSSPTAVIADPSPVASGGTTLDGSGSEDVDGTVAEHHWSLGDGTADRSGASLSHDFGPDGGRFDVRLRVVDDAGCSVPFAYTGQVVACRGDSAAEAVRTVVAPGAATGVVEPLTGRRARLTGEVTTFGRDATYHFEWGRTNAYGERSEERAAPAGGGPVALEVGGLEPETTYHVRLVARNDEVVTVGRDRTFTTGPDREPQEIAFPQPGPARYGDADLDPGATATSGLPVSLSAEPSGVCAVADGAIRLRGAGECTVTAEQAGDDAWLPAEPVARTFAVAPRAVRVIPDERSKVFGDDDPALTHDVDGLLEGDSLSGALEREAGEDVGSYAITPGTLDAGRNYRLSVEPARLLVTPRAVRVVPDERTKVYGEADPTLTYDATGLLDGDRLSGALARDAGEDVGSYAITPGTLDAGPNYRLSVETARFLVTPRAVRVVPDERSKVYGDDDPALTYDVTGLLHGHQLSGALAREAGEDVGSYAITRGTLDGGRNYRLSVAGASFSVSAARLRVDAVAQTKRLGEPDPPLTWTLSGYRRGESFATAGVTGAAECSVASQTGVGAAAITCRPGTLEARNYTVEAGAGATLTTTWSWRGFRQPINDTAHDAGDGTSVFKAGSTIPVKLQLLDVRGNPHKGSAPRWLGATKVGINDDPVSEIALAGIPSSAFSWDESGQQWQLNWSSPREPGFSYRLAVRLDDGTTQTVIIALK